MKLLHDVPEPILETLELESSDEHIMSSVPSNLSATGILIDGVRRLESRNVESGCGFKVVTLVGNGVLEMKRDDAANRRDRSVYAGETVIGMPSAAIS